jgi:hypothetical protein
MATHPIVTFALTSAACWVIVSTTSDESARPAVFLGAAGPFVIAAGAWWLIDRAHRRAPEQVSALMMKLFAVKMIVFAAYVVAVVTWLPAGAVPFVIAFAATFILLQALMAFHLRRLFASTAERTLPGRATGLVR